MWFMSLPYDSEAPRIDFKEGILILSGRCIPTDPDSTLGEIFSEIFKYLNTGNDLTIIFKFEAVNTASSMKFTNFFSRLNEIHSKDCLIKNKRKLNLIWNAPHIDEDMYELGEFYKNYSDNLAKKGKFDKIDFKLKYYNYG